MYFVIGEKFCILYILYFVNCSRFVDKNTGWYKNFRYYIHDSWTKSEKKIEFIGISWYNSIVEKGWHPKIRYKKRSYSIRWQRLKSKIIQKTYIYNIEENGGKPQIYIYVLIITHGAKKRKWKKNIIMEMRSANAV